jgi:hypothetical protein
MNQFSAAFSPTSSSSGRVKEVSKITHPSQRGIGKLNCFVILRFTDEHFESEELMA